MDRFTRWPEATPLPDSTTKTCVRALIGHWISRFGVPDDITSDRGPQFTSHMWSELHHLLGISAANTTAYCLQANGLVERFHRQLKDSLKARLQGPHWMDELPLVLLCIRKSWREDPGCSASDLVYGTSLRILGESLPHEPRDLRVSSSFSTSSRTTCVQSSHPHMSSTVDFLPTSPTTWLPMAGCMFATMPIAVRCSDLWWAVQDPRDSREILRAWHERPPGLGIHRPTEDSIRQTSRISALPCSSSDSTSATPVPSSSISAHNSCATAYGVCSLGQADQVARPLPVGLGHHGVPHWRGPCGAHLQN